MYNNSQLFVFGIVLVLLMCVLVWYYFYRHKSRNSSVAGGTCNVHKCGATDPVSDPKYNMTEIIKQSLLLEEHLVEKNKHCKDCICKHFLTIIALSEEAVCLAGSKVSKYPLMDSNVGFYKGLFNKWLKDKTSEHAQRKIQEELRERRKKLVELYVLDE